MLGTNRDLAFWGKYQRTGRMWTSQPVSLEITSEEDDETQLLRTQATRVNWQEGRE